MRKYLPERFNDVTYMTHISHARVKMSRTAQYCFKSFVSLAIKSTLRLILCLLCEIWLQLPKNIIRICPFTKLMPPKVIDIAMDWTANRKILS